MTNRRGRGPEPSDDLTHLSDEDVERRLGGDAGLGGPVAERVPAAAPPPPRPPRSRGRSVLWRDVLLVLVLLGFLGAGAQFVLNPASSVSTPPPGASSVALASPTSVAAPSPTVTATPVATEAAPPSDVIGSLLPEESPSAAPTPTPTPAPTPTPKPGTTPAPTPKPTAAPATLVVTLQVVHDSGGNAAAGSWTVHVNVGTTTIASFAGSVAGHSLQVPAGQTYAVSASSGPVGYAETLSGDCHLKPPSGMTEQCTITENDDPARLLVKMSVPSTTTVESFKVTLSAPNASPGGAVTESSSGVLFSLDAHSSYSVDVTLASGYIADTSDCDGADIANGAQRSCTVFISPGAASAPVARGSGGIWFLAAAVALPRRRLREESVPRSA